MENTILISFGKPYGGWLPVNFNYNDFRLNFDASDAVNYPLEELYSIITELQDNVSRQIIWWLEPQAYFFEFEKNGDKINLHITETSDLHDENIEKTTLLKISAEKDKVIVPFRDALKEFCSKDYDKNDWEYEKEKLTIL